MANSLSQLEADESRDGVVATSATTSDKEVDDKDIVEREHRLVHELQRMPSNVSASKTRGGDHHYHYHRLRQKKFTTQRSILKNSQDNATTTPNEDQELLEAKKQLILRKRRLFSHYRQYEQWRRRQFSYDPCYYRAALPPPVPICGGDYPTMHSSNPNAFRRRRQYRRQFSCAERSGEESRDSRESSHLTKCQSMAASDTIRTDSTTLNHANATTERHSFDSSECGALAYQPLHCSRHFHVFQEEHSTSISERITRSRINSAIFVSSEGRGFDSIEFLRRHGSQSVLCRKAKSAENITENGRKKSFADNRQWHTDDTNSGNEAQNDNAIELQECSKSVENHPIAALKTNVEKLLAATSLINHSATVTNSNKVVGSISIETPPSHIREEQQRSANIIIPPPPPPPLGYANPTSFNYASHDSTDTVEELVSIPIDPPKTIAPPAPSTVAAAISASAVTSATSIAPTRSRVLVRQRSSTASPVLSSSVHSSPKALKLKCITPKLNNLPMVSVSGPSPSDERPPPSDCL